MLNLVIICILKFTFLFSPVASFVGSVGALDKVRYDSQANPLHEVTERFIRQLDRLDRQGVVLVAEGSRVVYRDAGGIAYGGKQTQVSADSQFLIASVSKQFTAAALLKSLSREHPTPEAMERALDQPLVAYLDEGHEIWGGKCPKWAKQVTLHQLLTHTSGIRNYTDGKNFRNGFYWKLHSNTQVMNLVKSRKLDFRPGTHKSYSNTNFLLLSEVVSAVSGMPFDQYLEREFFHPLRMTSTYQPTAGHGKWLQNDPRFPDLIDSLEDDYSELGYYINLSNVQGCGAIISTVDDLHKWNVALHVDQKVLPKDLYEMMITNYNANSGLDHREKTAPFRF